MDVKGHPLDRCRWNAPGKELIEGCPQPVDIRPWTSLAGSRVLFRRRIAFSAGLAREGASLIRAGKMSLGDSQIHQHHMPPGSDDDVGGLDVAVEDGGNSGMEVLQRIADRQDPAEYLLLGERTSVHVRQFLLQILTVDEIHDQVESLVPLKMLTHLGDVVVIKRLQPLAFQLELSAGPRRLVDQFFQRVDILFAVEDIGYLVDSAETSTPYGRRHAIPFTYNRPNRQRAHSLFRHSAALRSPTHRTSTYRVLTPAAYISSPPSCRPSIFTKEVLVNGAGTPIGGT